MYKETFSFNIIFLWSSLLPSVTHEVNKTAQQTTYSTIDLQKRAVWRITRCLVLVCCQQNNKTSFTKLIFSALLHILLYSVSVILSSHPTWIHVAVLQLSDFSTKMWQTAGGQAFFLKMTVFISRFCIERSEFESQRAAGSETRLVSDDWWPRVSK